MATLGEYAILNDWFLQERKIEWTLTFGINSRVKPNIKGDFLCSPLYLDDQGKKWGDTHIRDIGKHYEEYSFWNEVSHLYPIGGHGNTARFEISNYTNRRYKGAAPGVTGLIGEVLVTTFLQKVLMLSPLEIAHLVPSKGTKAPDICLDIQPHVLANLLRDKTSLQFRQSNFQLANILESIVWSEPFPLECKSRRNDVDNHMRSALLQLLSYWDSIPEMSGYGMIAQIDVMPVTRLNLYLLFPKSTEILNVKNIIQTRYIDESNPLNTQRDPKLMDFKRALGGKLLG